MAARKATFMSDRGARASVQADVRRVATALGRRPSKGDYARQGRYSPADVLRATESKTWREAVDACGVAVALGTAGNNKYGARRTRKGANVYDSAKEASRGMELILEERAGIIKDLRRQVTIEILIDGVSVLTYRADYVYKEVSSGQIVIEDPKGARTRIYELKKSLIEALSPMKIREI